MNTFSEILSSVDEMKKAKQYDKLLGLLSYIHTCAPSSDRGIYALSEMSALFKDLGNMPKSLELMHQLLDTLVKKKDFKGAGDISAALACGSLYADGVTLASYYKKARAASVYIERHVPKMSHLNHDMQIGRRLKVGILSPDFCMHSLAFLIAQPLFVFTKHTQHELHLYHLRSLKDAATELFQSSATSFTTLHGQDNNAIAQRIYDDKIDVLIDLSGYTAETRLSVFAREPAPAQLGWISGMMTPTGLDCIPYFLTDKYMLPDKLPSGLCRPLRATTALTYHPLRGETPEVGAPPFQTNGVITFGSFNNPCKINTRLLKAWAQILQKVPRSRLHLKVYSSMDAARITETMGFFGADTSRISFVEHLPTSINVQEYYSKNIDIFLDSWPCSGCLTTAEALWMGIPTVSYYEDLFCSRQTHSILNNIGISDLSVPSVDGYVNTATSLANDAARLMKLRTELRDMMKASPLCDYVRMAKELGKAVESVWESTVASRKNSLDAIQKVA